MNINKFLCNIDRDPFKGLYLQFTLQISGKIEEEIDYRLFNENNIEIYKNSIIFSEENNIYEYSNIIYLEKAKFIDYYTNIKLIISNSNGESLEKINTIPTFKVNIGEVQTNTIKENDIVVDGTTYFNWDIDNFSLKDMYIGMELKNDSMTILEENLKIIHPTSYKQKKISIINIKEFIDNLSNNLATNISYRLVIKNSLVDIKPIYEPEVGYLTYKISKINDKPDILLDNMLLTYQGDRFDLSLDAIFHDSDLDDVKYTITDNHGNYIFQQDHYTYTPQIENIRYNYSNKYFNSIFLKLNAKIQDTLTTINERQFNIPLFSVKNLRLRRDRLYWDVTNYSNNVLKTNVEILDMYNNLVYSGEVQSNKGEFTPITVTDDKPIPLLQTINVDYYKFRVKVESAEDDYIDYVEFKNGTITTVKDHKAPIISNIEGSLNRDLDNNKTITMSFEVDGTLGDLFKYKIYDNSNNDIFMSRDFISTPNKISITVPYDFTEVIISTITISVTNEYDKTSKETIELDAFYIRNIKVFMEKMITFDVDNYCIHPIDIIAEVYEDNLDKDGKVIYDVTNLFREEKLTIENTIDSIHQKIRFIPKLYGKHPFHVRLRVENEFFTEVRYIYLDETLSSFKNTKPLISVNTIQPIFNSNNILDILYNITFTDTDYDRMKYNLSCNNQVIEKTDSFIEPNEHGSISINGKNSYKLEELNTSLLQLYMSVIDEESDKSEIYYKIPLYTINNLDYDNNGVFSWTYKLFTDRLINMELEVLDNEGYLYGRVKPLQGYYRNDLNTVSTNIILDNYEEGNYKYRLKVSASGEEWVDYYPSIQGEDFHIDKTLYNIPQYSNRNINNIEEVKELATEDPYKYLKTIYGELEDSDLIKNRLEDIITNEDPALKLKTIKELLNIYSNYQDSKIFNIRNSKGSYNAKPYTNHANSTIFNKSIKKLEFNIEEFNHMEIEKYHLRAFNKGKKINEDDYHMEIKHDGLSKLYINDDVIDNSDIIEIESYKNFINDAEKLSISLSINNEDMIQKLSEDGMIIPHSYNDSVTKLSIHIIRNEKRINPYRYNIKRTNNELLVHIKDPLYIGDTVYITTNTLYLRDLAEIMTETVTKGNISYLKPVYFIPFSFVEIGDDIITNMNKAEVYINGYCATPIKDYTILPANDKLSLPTIILFKDLLFENSKVEIFYRDTDMDNSSIYKDVLSFSNSYAYFQIEDTSLPLIDGTFTVYQDNKKVPNDEYIILSDRHIAFRKYKWKDNIKEVCQNKNIYNYYIKFNYPNNKFINTLLRLYNENKDTTPNINNLIESLSIRDKETLLLNSDINSYDKLEYLKYIYELNGGEDFKWLEKIKDNKEYYLENGIDCNTGNLSDKDILFNETKTPLVFNHNINISANTSILDRDNIEDNITNINPSRVLQIFEVLDETQTIDCNTKSMEYDIQLNEEVGLDMEYIISDINFDCNKLY